MTEDEWINSLDRLPNDREEVIGITTGFDLSETPLSTEIKTIIVMAIFYRASGWHSISRCGTIEQCNIFYWKPIVGKLPELKKPPVYCTKVYRGEILEKVIYGSYKPGKIGSVELEKQFDKADIKKENVEREDAMSD